MPTAQCDGRFGRKLTGLPHQPGSEPVPDRNEAPKILFFLPGEKGIIAKAAYLVRVNGEPWAFADPAELHKDPHDANAFPLDPLRIVKESITETGQTYYAYRGEPLAFPR